MIVMEPGLTLVDRYRPEEPDLISDLPCDVLVSIMEKLDLRDAVRVGVLSRRWRCLPAQLPKLILDIDHFMPADDGGELCDDDGELYENGGENYDDGDELYDDGHDDDGQDDDGEEHYVDSYNVSLWEAGRKMAGALTALLASRRPTAGGDNGSMISLDVHTTLAMRFYLTHNYLSLGRLLDDAVASGKVRAAELTVITTAYWSAIKEYESEDRAALFTYGQRFRTLFDASPMAFGALTQLTLENMFQDMRDLDDVLATCTRLERLSLSTCGPWKAGLWEIRHARLKYIRIIWLSCTGVKLVWLPSLERFSFKNWFFLTDEVLSLGHVPRLATVNLTHDNGRKPGTVKLSRILANSNALISDLRLNFSYSNIWVQPETSRRLTDVFRNLKNLKIHNVHRECGLSWTMFLVQSAPNLQELFIKLMEHDGCEDFSRKNVPWEIATGFKHYSLSRVIFLGFYSFDEIIMPFLHHLVQAAVNLEEMYIRQHPTFQCEVCDQMEPPAKSRFPRTNQEKDALRSKITDGRTTATVKIHIQCLPN